MNSWLDEDSQIRFMDLKPHKKRRVSKQGTGGLNKTRASKECIKKGAPGHLSSQSIINQKTPNSLFFLPPQFLSLPGVSVVKPFRLSWLLAYSPALSTSLTIRGRST